MSTGVHPGFLSFTSMPPRLHITGDTPNPDPILLQHFIEEGFDATYLPRGGGGKPYRDELARLNDDLELGESYAIVAFGAAATDCLSAHVKPQPHLAALIAYYPSTIQDPKSKFPSQLDVLCHIAGSQGFAPAFSSYTYQNAKPGFAEHSQASFNKIAASLAWTRTLGVLRKAFKIETNLEHVREDHIRLSFAGNKASATVANMVAERPHVTNVPTMTGGIGQRDLFVFYRDYFKNPPSLRMKLVSRTIGEDRVVDELVLSLKHTEEVPWLLPGVPATDKMVHVAMVSVVCIRGGRVYHEHVYWDQASVLVQVGLLDPKLVPDHMKRRGLKQLPVYGAETAAKVLNEESHPNNELISSWKDRPKGDPGALPNRPKQTANGARSEEK
ncbi:hypothetical protein LTR09_001201 [Extremus antarcticus]|uniref:Dienelactone hydrolase n=1 Tax=Extremus antarcticus TaxID=702011 RepID=A0AAJ0GIB2_9PEZI|nr:hypothetical protein LTR09_001201 [Extremus antarcticus]